MNVPLVMFVWCGRGRHSLRLGRSAHYSLKGTDRLYLLFSMYSLFLLSNG